MSGERRQCGEGGNWQSRSNFARHVRGHKERRAGATRKADPVGDNGDPAADEGRGVNA